MLPGKALRIDAIHHHLGDRDPAEIGLAAGLKVNVLRQALDLACRMAGKADRG